MIAALLVSLVAVGFFAATLYITGIVKVAKSVLQHAYQGIGIMTDVQLTDDEKELGVRRAGIKVLLGAWSIFWRFAVCITATFLPIYLADIIHFADQGDIFELMLRIDYIVVVSLTLIAVVWLFKRFQSVADDSNKLENKMSYNMGERIIHMLAFASPLLQRLIAGIDDWVFKRFHRNIEHRSPLFITSLARGGTTSLLNAFSDLPFIATHTYRDMPFITAPYLWRRLSTLFKRKVVRIKRAHNDGLEIDLNSPEAFDEVYWRLYWPEKYKKNKIVIWQTDDIKSEAITRLRTCFQKIAYARDRPDAHYLSKNNANIARLRVISQSFPGAKVIVVVRRPVAHAASLLRQHNNFLKLQSEDDFIRRYMNDIGHLEFGHLHKPMLFDDFDKTAYSPDHPDYWLTYWIAAFQEVLVNIDCCHIVFQDDLRSDPNSCIHQLLTDMGFNASNRDFTPYFRSGADEADSSVFSPDILARADSLYSEILEKVHK